MFDHFTQSAAVQEKLASLEQKSGCFRFFEEPPSPLENLPKGLIEDEI